MPGRFGLGDDLPAAGDHQRYLRVSAAAVAERGELGEFAGGEVRVAQRHQVDPRLVGAVQLAPGVAQALATDPQGPPRRAAAEGAGQVRGFRGDADDVEHRHRGTGAQRRAEGLERVAVRLPLPQAVDRRDLSVAEQAAEVAEGRVEGIVDAAEVFHFDQYPRLALLVEVAAGQRRATGEGAADIHEVGVLVGACAEHAVGEEHRVGLGPDDLFAGTRAVVEQVGRAGEAGLRAHVEIGLGQGRGWLAEGGGYALFAPAALVHGDGVEGGRYPHPGTEVAQGLGEAQAGRAGVDASVDVRALDLDQPLRALQRRHAQDDAHRQARGFAVFAGEQGLVEGVQSRAGIGRQRFGGPGLQRRRGIAVEFQATVGQARPGIGGEFVEALAETGDG